MVPRSPFKSNNAAASRQKELQKTMCVPDEKRLSLRKLYQFAVQEVDSQKKGDVVLYVRTTKGSFLGKDTFKASTRPKKISTAKVAELEAVEWFENSIKPMLNRSSIYSAKVQQALADIAYHVATHNRVLLSDPEFLSLLQVVVEATPVVPERECPAIPLAVQQPNVGASDIPPPMVTMKQPMEETNLTVVQARLKESLDRCFQDMRARGQTERELFDSQGQLVAQLTIRARQVDALICLDEVTDKGVCRQGFGIHMTATSQDVYVSGAPLSSLGEEKAIAQASHWLALAQRFEAQIVPVTINEVAVLKEQVSAATKAMARLYQAMSDEGCARIWVDRGFNVWTTAVDRDSFLCSATIKEAQNGAPLLTLETYDAYWSKGRTDKSGTALMSKNESDGLYTVGSFRLNGKDLNKDDDFQKVDYPAAIENMKGVLSMARSFAADVDELKRKAAST